MNATDISELVERELLGITEPELVRRIRELLVHPYPVERVWDYGTSYEAFTCWTVLDPWGLVFLSGPLMSIGMDSAWFTSLEDAIRESAA